jgi:hypothetical protein
MNEFKLKNYTTEVGATQSLQEIEKLLISFGASAIMKEYINGKISSISFKLKENGFKLPATVEGVYNTMPNPRNRSDAKLLKAERIAWRIIKDWLHAQLSIVKSGQAEPEQVLLPYLFDGKQTLYDRFRKGGLKLEYHD